MSFTHIVSFKWTDSTYDAAPVAEALSTLVAGFDGVQKYICGPDIGLSPGSFDFAVVGVFDDRDSWTVYRDHPEHKRIISEMIAPYVDTRVVVQLED